MESRKKNVNDYLMLSRNRDIDIKDKCIDTKEEGCGMSWEIKIDIQFSSVTQLCPALCDPMNHSTPGLPVHHHSIKSLELSFLHSPTLTSIHD